MTLNMNDFYASLDNAISGTDSATFWPGGGGQIGASFITIDAFEFYSQLKELKEKMSPSEAKKLFNTPSVIRYIPVGNFIIGMRLLIRDGKVDPDSAEEVLQFLFEILDEKMDSDPFCVTGKNLWYSEEDISKIINSKKFVQPNEDEQKIISRTVIALNSLVWSFYYDIYVEAGFEFHGPYNVNYNGENYQLLIRDYHNLKPSEIWGLAENFEYKSIRFYLLYQNVDIKIDYFMHEVSYNPLRTNLKYFFVETNDGGKEKELVFSELEKISESAEKIAFDQVALVNKLPVLDKMKKGAEICYYQLKPFRDSLNIDWKPSKEVYDAIELKGLENWERFKARAERITRGEEKPDWKAKYNIRIPFD
jgi:hypothetical protein